MYCCCKSMMYFTSLVLTNFDVIMPVCWYNHNDIGNMIKLMKSFSIILKSCMMFGSKYTAEQCYQTDIVSTLTRNCI